MTGSEQPVNVVRALIAILGALVLFSGLSQVLEYTLVRTAGGDSLTSMAAYMAILNRPSMLAIKLAINVAVAVLTGYMCARIAGSREMLFAALTAAAESCTLAWGLTTGEYAVLPLAVRILLVATAGPGILAGAWIRLQARVALAGAPLEEAPLEEAQ